MIINNGFNKKDVKGAIYQLFIDQFNDNNFVYIAEDDLQFSMRTRKDQDNITLVKDYFRKSLIKRNSDKVNIILGVLNEMIPGSKVTSKCIYKTKIRIETIKNISDYLRFLKSLPLDKNSNFYRGQSNFKWEILPSVYRHPSLVINEKLMMDKMLQANPEEFNYSSTFDVLSKLQHYNLPTRLIDVTINPLVALFFAVNTNKSEDGQVFVFSPPEDKIKYSDSDTVSVLANISKMEIDFGNNDIGTPKIERFIHFIRKEKPFFENYLEDNCFDDYVFVHASYNNKRIAKQNGAFILVGVKDTKMTPAEVVSKFKIGSKVTKLLIPFNEKRTILKELELLSIHDGTLFPEIDKNAEHITKEILGL